MMPVEATPPGSLSEQVVELHAHTALDLQSDERTFGWSTRLPPLDGAPLKIAVAGPHNAGKSMLVAALLKLPADKVAEITGAIPLTDQITPYEWSGCILLDLPGTQSGLDLHDATATTGLRQADLLLLVTSIELPGEEETAQIRRVLGDEGFARRVLVVVNKCNSEDNDPDVIRAEMRERLSPFPWVNPLFADAKDYVDALNAEGLTEEDRCLYRAESGVDEVASALATLVRDHGSTARLQGVCHEIRRIAVEASNRWMPDEEAQALELSAHTARAALEHARTQLTEETHLAVDTLGERLREVGNRLAGAVTEQDATVSKTDIAQAEKEERQAHTEFEDFVNQRSQEILGRLDQELETSLEDFDRYSADAAVVAESFSGGHSRNKGSWFVEDAFDKAWGTGMGKLRERLDAVIDGGSSQGSPAYDLALRFKKFRGGAPAKPYEHRHNADKIVKGGKTFSALSDFLTPLVDGKGIVDDIVRIRAVKKRQEEIRSHYAAMADRRTREEMATVDGYIESRLARRHELLGALLESAAESERTRTEAQARWCERAEQASALAARLDVELKNEPVH